MQSYSEGFEDSNSPIIRVSLLNIWSQESGKEGGYHKGKKVSFFDVFVKVPWTENRNYQFLAKKIGSPRNINNSLRIWGKNYG